VSSKPSGKIIPISDYTVKLTVKDVDGTVLKNLAVKPLADDASNVPGSNGGGSGGSGSGDKKDAAPYLRPAIAAVVLPMVAAFFL
jgi:hypothetical protein